MTVAKIWTGSSWFSTSAWSRPKIWNGSSWVQTSIRESRNASNASATLTVGTANISASKFAPAGTRYGFSSSGSYGSLSNRTAGFPWHSNITIDELYWQTDGLVPSGAALIYIVSSNTSEAITDSGWTSISFNGYTFTRASSTFFVNFWFWSTATNPFPAAGNSTTINWT